MNETSGSTSDLNDFEDIQIEFVTGDEVMVYHEISFTRKGQKIIAKKEQPFYYYGSLTDSTWTTKLEASDLKIIDRFISKAKTQKDSCSFLSTSIDHYKIKIGNKEEMKIIGNCEWDGIDYDYIEKNIFKSHFADLENKRKIVADSIAKSFTGTWDVSGWENGKLTDKEILLTRTNVNKLKTEGQYRWTFDKSNTTALKEDLDIDEGSSLIKIRGSTYKIINISADKIELKHLW